MRLRYTAAAEDDLAQVAQYGSVHWSSEQASRYLETLISGCELLCRLPRIGRLTAGRIEGLRRYRIRQHVILYTTNDLEIQVLRVLHLRRKQTSTIA